METLAMVKMRWKQRCCIGAMLRNMNKEVVKETSESTCDAPMVLLKLPESLNRGLEINRWYANIL